MENLSDKQKAKLMALAEIADNGDLAVVTKMFEMQDEFDTAREELGTLAEEFKSVAESLKGEVEAVAEMKKQPGEPGKKGDSVAIGDVVEALIPHIPQPQKIDTSAIVAEVLSLLPEAPESPEDDGAETESIVQEILSKLPPVEPVFLDTPEQVVDKVNESAVLIKKEKVEGLADIERIAKANSVALPPTTSFFNGKRGKNLTIIGGTAVQKGDTIEVTTPSGGATTFTSLTDAPSSYSSQAGKAVRVNAGETGLEFFTAAGSGTVTNIASADGSITVTNPTTTADLAVVKAPKLTTARTIAITGDLTYTSPSFDGSANVTAAGTIANSAVTLAKQADVATATVFYRKTAGTGAPEVQTLATLKTDLGLTGTNSGDQTSIVGITGTKAQFDTAVTDGNILYVGDVTQYTDELAQDAVGAMVDASLTYVDATPLLQRAALTGDVTASAGSNATTVVKINGTTLSGLATGILKNTTGTGVPSIATAGTDYSVPTGTETITNKRPQPRTASSTSNATLTPDLSSANVYYRTTQTVGLTIAAPTGTPVIGEVITIYVDSAGAQTLTMNATYIVFGAAFPASTTAGKTLMITAQFNGTDWKTTWVNQV